MPYLMGDQRCPCKCHPNWGYLKGACPGKISPSDIDAMLEHFGHFLFIEAKHLGEQVSTGQRLWLERLSKKEDCDSMVIYFKDRETPERIEMCSQGVWLAPEPTSQIDLYQRVESWFGVLEKIYWRQKAHV